MIEYNERFNALIFSYMSIKYFIRQMPKKIFRSTKPKCCRLCKHRRKLTLCRNRYCLCQDRRKMRQHK